LTPADTIAVPVPVPVTLRRTIENPIPVDFVGALYPRPSPAFVVTGDQFCPSFVPSRSHEKLVSPPRLNATQSICTAFPPPIPTACDVYVPVFTTANRENICE